MTNPKNIETPVNTNSEEDSEKRFNEWWVKYNGFDPTGLAATEKGFSFSAWYEQEEHYSQLKQDNAKLLEVVDSMFNCLKILSTQVQEYGLHKVNYEYVKECLEKYNSLKDKKE